MTELVTDPQTDQPTNTAITLRGMVDGQTAAHLVLAADDYEWWTQLLAGHPVRPVSGVEGVVADGLIRCSLLAPTADGRGIDLTDAGRDVALARGFLRVVARGWEPTFRRLTACRADEMIPADADADQVAHAAAEIVERRPDILLRVGEAIDAGTPGTTVDLGCADASRIIGLADVAPRERFLGIDIEQDIVTAAAAKARRGGVDDRVSVLAGSVHPGDRSPTWLGAVDRSAVTTAMSFLLVHQMASDTGSIETVLQRWQEWFPNLARLVVGDGMRMPGSSWHEQPWFSPSYETYHSITGVRVWSEPEHTAAFASLGWTVVDRLEDHMLVTFVLERR